MRKLFGALCVWGGMASSFISFGQHTDKCALQHIIDAKLANNPELAAQYTEHLAAGAAAPATTAAAKTTASVTIPLVFHVILTQTQINQLGGDAGIYKRVASQINALNRDFNARNPDQANIPTVFKPLFANAEMNFALARRDPSGKATGGVEVKVTTITSFDETDGRERRTSTGGMDPWDENRYLNIWIVNLTSSGVLGYAFSPQLAQIFNTPSGATLDYLAFGQKELGINTTSLIDSGRTLVHELGHFFTLNHIWGNTAVGSGNCNDDDGINDTPIQKDANYSCPSVGTVIANCTNSPGGEMYMNYMDYVNDRCMIMFTKGQVTKMRAELATTSKGLTENPQLTYWPTDVADMDAKQLDIFPNPATQAFTISFPDNQRPEAINVVNMMGQSVKSISVASATSYNFDMSGMAKGIYLVHVRYQEGTVTRKLVLQ